MPMRTKEEQREYQRLWIKRRRQSWIDANGPCQMCGSSDKLEVDHKDRTTKIFHPRSLWSMSDKNPNKIAELAKCWVLCESCHMVKSRECGDLGFNSPKGESQGSAVATEEIVIAIRAEYIPRVVTQRMLGERYGLARQTVEHILNGRSWQHI